MKRQRDRLEAELADLERRNTVADQEGEVDAIVDRLWRLDQELQDATPARLRELLGRMVQRIELKFELIPRGKRVECKAAGGMVLVHPASIYGSANRGDMI